MFAVEPTDFKAFWLKRVETCAELHTRAIEQAKNWPGKGLLPQELTNAVLGYGNQLDHAIMTAMEHGAEIPEILSISGLHPLYVDELTRAGRL